MAHGKETVIYVTRDIERAIGMVPNDSYYIVSNTTPFGESVRTQHPDFVRLIDDGKDESAGTGDLMKDPATQELFQEVFRKTGSRPYLMVFKNTARIEPIAKENGWTLINPSAAASEKVENKISQIAWLGELERLLPPHRLEFVKNVRPDKKPFILQWAHGHTGGGTVLISDEQDLSALKARFPERRCRVTAYVPGPSFTLNVVVTPEKIITSSISYQITGEQPFTASSFATIGNDWGLAHKSLSQEDRQAMHNMAMEIGFRMQKDFWRGLFGIDVIKDAATGKIHLIEVNARQPASTSFESELQLRAREKGAVGLTTFEAHLMALVGHPVSKPLIEIRDGAQILQRVTEETRSVSRETIGALELEGFRAIPYSNASLNSDLLRIQSPVSIMSEHGSFNDIGKKIIERLR